MRKIKKILTRLYLFMALYQILLWLRNYPSFILDFIKIKKLSKNSRFPVTFGNNQPYLLDNTKETNIEPHYTYHPAWAARIVSTKIKPEKHIDISSVLYFSTMVSAFIPVEFYDFRPAELKLNNLECKKADLTNLQFKDNSIESISCMHTVEHVGLGRYGDQIDPDGDLKAMHELIRVVKPGGSLIFVVPIGKSKIEFNAHRIYSYKQINDIFKESMITKEFSLIPDNFKEAGIIYNASEEESDRQHWGCGCFWFIKKIK
jgi:predicted SAM-dependent methyltransferase